MGPIQREKRMGIHTHKKILNYCLKKYVKLNLCLRHCKILLNSPTIGPAGDLVDVWYTGYPDCKGTKLGPPLQNGQNQVKPLYIALGNCICCKIKNSHLEKKPT